LKHQKENKETKVQLVLKVLMVKLGQEVTMDFVEKKANEEQKDQGRKASKATKVTKESLVRQENKVTLARLDQKDNQEQKANKAPKATKESLVRLENKVTPARLDCEGLKGSKV
jgi:hypothetical protein